MLTKTLWNEIREVLYSTDRFIEVRPTAETVGLYAEIVAITSVGLDFNKFTVLYFERLELLDWLIEQYADEINNFFLTEIATETVVDKVELPV